MPRLRRLVLPALAAVALTLASCTPAPPDPPEGGPETPPVGTVVNENASITVGTLHAPVDLADPEDPGSAEALTGNVYESLFRLAETGEAVPLLAKNFERSADGLVYTIPLRTDATFSDGSPLTADDVVASLAPLLAEDGPVTAVNAVAGDTVEIDLDRPVVSLPHTLAGVWIHRDELGTGPYTIGTFSSGSSLTLDRNPAYWQEPAKNAHVEFREYPAAADLVAAIESGRVDLSPAMPPLPVNPSNGVVVSEAASTTRVLLAFNDEAPPFDDPEVRVALSHAIDDDAIRTALWGDAGTPISSMALPSEPWHEDLSDIDAYEPDAARAALQPLGLDAPIVVVDGPLVQAAQLIAQQLEAAGVTAPVEKISADQWRERVVDDRDFVLALGTVSGDHRVASIGDPGAWWGYHNPDVMGWSGQVEAMSNEAEQTELMRLIDLTSANEAANEWLFLEPREIVASADVAGYPLTGPFLTAGIEKSE